MLRTCAPDKSVLECVFEGSVDLITDVFDCAVGADDESFVEGGGFGGLSLGEGDMC